MCMFCDPQYNAFKNENQKSSILCEIENKTWICRAVRLLFGRPCI